MSTTAQLITDLKNHGFDDMDNTTALTLLNDTLYEAYSAVNGIPFYETTATLTSVAGTDGVTGWPSTFGKIIKLVDNSSTTTLVRSRRETIQSSYTDGLALQADPVYYYMYGGNLHVYPLFPDTRTLVLDYTRQPTAMANAANEVPDFPVIHHRLLVLGAIVRAMLQEDDSQVASVFQAEYDKKLATIQQEIWATNYDRADIIVDVSTDSDSAYYF